MGKISWLTNPTILGGSHISLEAVAIKLSGKQLNTATPTVGKDTSLPYGSKLSFGDNVGMENPIYDVTGRFVTEGLTDAGSLTMKNVQRLGSFIYSGSSHWFYDDQLILNPAGSAYVDIVDFGVNKTIKDEDNYFAYNLKLREVREE